MTVEEVMAAIDAEQAKLGSVSFKTRETVLYREVCRLMAENARLQKLLRSEISLHAGTLAAALTMDGGSRGE
jgi:hypothetical protein